MWFWQTIWDGDRQFLQGEPNSWLPGWCNPGRSLQSKHISVTLSAVRVSLLFPRTRSVGVKVFKHTETKLQPDTSRLQGRAKDLHFQIIQYFQLSLTLTQGWHSWSQSWFITLNTMWLVQGNSRYRRNRSQSKHNQRQPLGLGCTGTTSSHVCPCLVSQHGAAVRRREMGSHPARTPVRVRWDALTHPQVSSGLHCWNTGRVWFSSHAGKPGINTHPFHKFVLRTFLP